MLQERGGAGWSSSKHLTRQQHKEGVAGLHVNIISEWTAMKCDDYQYVSIITLHKLMAQ